MERAGMCCEEIFYCKCLQQYYYTYHFKCIVMQVWLKIC